MRKCQRWGIDAVHARWPGRLPSLVSVLMELSGVQTRSLVAVGLRELLARCRDGVDHLGYHPIQRIPG